MLARNGEPLHITVTQVEEFGMINISDGENTYEKIGILESTEH